VQLNSHEVRDLIDWRNVYDPRWDTVPDHYVVHGFVQQGKSRRLGLVRLGRCKAYLGVQHVDPSKPGWGIFEQPQTRFFVSMFLDRECVALRTFQTMEETLEALAAFMSAPGR
jgi:hypothetical protein